MQRTGWLLGAFALASAFGIVAGYGLVATPDAVAGPSSTSGEEIPFEAYLDCDIRFPNGSPAPCEGEATTVEYKREVPTGWVRWLGETSDEDSYWCLYRKAGGLRTYGLAYEIPQRQNETYGQVSGVLRIETGGGTFLYNWTGPSREGFVAFPDRWGSRLNYSVMIYGSSYTTNVSSLRDGALRQAWSDYGGDLWLIQHLRADNRTYHFPVGGDRDLFGYSETFTDESDYIHLSVYPWKSWEDDLHGTLPNACP